MPEPRLLCQQWTLHHGDLGTEQDGHSLHLSDYDRLKYLNRHELHESWEHKDRIEAGELTEPIPVSRANGDPYWVTVGPITYARILASPLPGLRFHSRTPDPPPEAQGCWRELRRGGSNS